MTTRSSSMEVTTPSRLAVVNVTAEVRRALSRGGVRTGIAVVSVPHTTCGLCVNEDEAGLRDDLLRLGERLLDPLQGEAPFRHDRVDDNARAHLTSILIGNSATLPVSDGELRLGTWQSVFLLELDGPRTRRLDLIVLGE